MDFLLLLLLRKSESHCTWPAQLFIAVFIGVISGDFSRSALSSERLVLSKTADSVHVFRLTCICLYMLCNTYVHTLCNKMPNPGIYEVQSNRR